MIRTYGARHPEFRPAPKPANLDALTAAASARDGDAFRREHSRYLQQATRAGVHPGTLLGWIDPNGDLS